MRQVKPIRDAYRNENPFCQWPRCRSIASELHEIARGAARGAALDQPAALLHLCNKHHTHAHNKPSVARDLAVKQMSGDGHYDLAKVNSLRGKVITQEEVDEAAESLSTICPRCRGNGYTGARPDDYGQQVRCESCRGTGERT